MPGCVTMTARVFILKSSLLVRQPTACKRDCKTICFEISLQITNSTDNRLYAYARICTQSKVIYCGTDCTRFVHVVLSLPVMQANCLVDCNPETRGVWLFVQALSCLLRYF